MAGDPRDYFKVEARELIDGLTHGAIRAERAGVFSPADRKNMLRLAHTLKGAARVVGEGAIAEAAHGVEDLLAEAGDAPDPSLVPRLLARIDAMTAALPPVSVAPADAPAEPAGPARQVRIDRGDVDDLLARVSALAARQAAIRAALESAEASLTPAGRDALVGLQAVTAELADLRASVRELRMLPARAILVALERTARDAAREAGLDVRFTASGDQRLDGDVLDVVRDALIQVVRNAVAHGIEPAAERVRAGKPATGTVHLTIARRGGDVAFTCDDDGRGLDLAALRAAAVARGLAAADRARELDESAIAALLMQGGLSSARDVSQLSGRGVGLELARTALARVGGRLSMGGHAGGGTRVDIVVPVSSRSVECLTVHHSTGRALVPLAAVAGIARMADVERVAGGGVPSVALDGEIVPFVSLSRALGAGAASREADRFVIGLTAGGVRCALGVIATGRVAPAIVQALPPFSAAAPIVSALAMDDDGALVPMVEPRELVAAHAEGPEIAETPRARRVLVIDDSITTRMLEQSILESAGYLVDAVASGEDGLARARASVYDLFIVDVEMPGMNGFEFVEQVRADETLAATPAMLVTSRGAAEDRARGARAGANAYIVKGAFDQEVFLSTIRGLVG